MGSDDTTEGLRIGELAESTGLTVRTLHHYEAVGLLAPAGRTAAGHRVYGPEQVQQLYRIVVLRSLGLPLPAIRDTTDGNGAGLRDVLAEHLAQVERRLGAERRLRARLAAVVDRLADAGARPARDDPAHDDPAHEDPTSDLLRIMEETTMLQPTVDRGLQVLVYQDLEAAFAYVTRVFALEAGELTRDPDGGVVHGSVRAGDGEIWLHPESAEFGLASPQHLGGATSTVVVLVDDVDEHHRHAVEQGADVRYGPVDQPYGYREYGAVDPEGHLWSFMRPLG